MGVQQPTTKLPVANLIGNYDDDVDANGKGSLNAVARAGLGPLTAVACAASGTQILGTGAIGDLLSSINIIPDTTSPGSVVVHDGAGAAYTVFTGGAASVTCLVPFAVAFDRGILSVTGAWSITVGANVHVIAFGRFTP